MAQRIFTCLLILLLLSSCLDDIQAAASPDTDDDILAMQDNEYLPAVCQYQTRRVSGAGAPFAGWLDTLASDPRTASTAMSSLGRFKPSSWLGLNILYVIMSFQC